jgi:hypothetical protein
MCLLESRGLEFDEKSSLFVAIPAAKKEMKKETRLGISNKKDENFGDWYSEVLSVIVSF